MTFISWLALIPTADSYCIAQWYSVQTGDSKFQGILSKLELRFGSQQGQFDWIWWFLGIHCRY